MAGKRVTPPAETGGSERRASGRRVLGRVRLSRLTEESTSAARQRELIEQWTAANGHTIAGWAEDIDVSGSIDPFESPELGAWFAEDKRGEWDVLVAWKLDRYGRDSIRLNKLFGWCIDNQKTLVSTSEGIDLSTPVGRLIANVIAFLAEGELDAIRERTKASRKALLEAGRWPGGIVPYGFRPVELTAGGWKLEIEPEQAAVIRRIAAEIINGSAVEAVAIRLDEDAVPAPRGGGWSRTTVWRIAESKYLLGHATYGGETVRDIEGRPVLYAEPLLTRIVWDDLQNAIAERRTPESSKRTRNTSPLLGILVCMVCESRMVHRTYVRKRDYRYYHCPNRHFPQVDAETAEQLVEESFLANAGDRNVRERVYIQAENHQIELDEAVQAVDELTTLVGGMTSDTMRKRLTEQLSALDLRIAELEKLPVSESRWEYRETRETYREAWEQVDVEGRRQLLLRSGITAAVKLDGKTRQTPGSLDFELRVPDNIWQRLST